MSYTSSSMITNLKPNPAAKSQLSDWQAKLKSEITGAEGFLSLEMSPCEDKWILNQTFNSKTNLNKWRQSKMYQDLIQELKNSHAYCLTEVEKEYGSVTEVYVSFVQEGKYAEYQEWLKKVHQMESTFPGFQKIYVQAPDNGKEGCWITLLQFDSENNLQLWLNSSERKALLDESQSFMKSTESHRLYSSFDGWFMQDSANPPSEWKQSMLVLLILFPLIMLEILLLFPYMTELNLPTSRFLGCMITVALLCWPLMPLTIRLFDWWLKASKHSYANYLGTVIISILYVIEILIFSHLTLK